MTARLCLPWATTCAGINREWSFTTAPHLVGGESRTSSPPSVGWMSGRRTGGAPDWLLETGQVTSADLDERDHIGRAARLIRSYWMGGAASRSTGVQHLSATTASLAWQQARGLSPAMGRGLLGVVRIVQPVRPGESDHFSMTNIANGSRCSRYTSFDSTNRRTEDATPPP